MQTHTKSNQGTGGKSGRWCSAYVDGDDGSMGVYILLNTSSCAC